METELPGDGSDVEETPDGTPDDDDSATPEPENDTVEEDAGAEGDGSITTAGA